MKNICFVHCVGVIGGAERVSQAIIRGLNQQHNLYLACPEKGELSTESALLNAKPVFHNIYQPDFKHPLKTLKSNCQWHKIIKSNQIDIFHTGDLLSTRSLIKTAKKNNVKILCHIHFPFQRAFAAWVFDKNNYPDGFIFCSQELQDDVGTMLNELCPKSTQWVVHNGVDTNKYSPAPAKNNHPRVGIVANLQYRKGHDEFLAMAKIIVEQYPNAIFDIIGGDIMQEPREGLLKSKANELGIAENVVFHGQVSDVKSLVDKLDVYVCASHQEAFPISILEAMACGKAIVSTNVNGIPEAIIDTESGLLVPAKSASQLASSVLRVLNDSNLKKTLSNNARNRVEELFSEKVFQNNIANIYEQL